MKPVYIDIDNLTPMNIYYFTLLYEKVWDWWICQFIKRENNNFYFRWKEVKPSIYYNDMKEMVKDLKFIVNTYISNGVPKSWFLNNETRFYHINSVYNFQIDIKTLTSDTLI